MRCEVGLGSLLLLFGIKLHCINVVAGHFIQCTDYCNLTTSYDCRLLLISYAYIRVLCSSDSVLGAPLSTPPFSVNPARYWVRRVQPNVEPWIASHCAEHSLESRHAYLHVMMYIHVYIYKRTCVLSSGVMCFNHWMDRPTTSMRNAVASLGQ